MPPGSSPAARTRRRFLKTGGRLVAGLAILVSAGTLLLLIPGMATRPLALNEAAFTATSALAVTGLSLITPAQDLTVAGQTVLMVLIQVGGVGFMAGAVVILRLLGRRVSLADRLALRDSLGLLEPRAVITILWRIMLTAVVIESIATGVLWLNWREQLGGARAAFYAVFHAVSAFCNAGFDLFGGATDAAGAPFAGIPSDPVTLTTFGALIVLGGLGIPVIGNFIWDRGRLTLHTRITLAVYLALILIGAAGFLVAEGYGGALSGVPTGRALLFSTFTSISARTAGFSVLPSLEALTPASQWMMMGLMLIGCAPASMGGGITTGTFAVLVLSLVAFTQGKSAAEIGGRRIAQDAVRRAAAVLTASLAVVAVATWLILLTNSATLDKALFEVVSAFATCGLTLAFTQDLNLFGQFVIMFVMFWGRLGALTIVVALAQQAPAQAVHYPEEPLLIG